MGKNHIMSQWGLGFSSNDTSTSYKSKVKCNLPIFFKKKKSKWKLNKELEKYWFFFWGENFLFMLNRVQYYSGNWGCKNGGLWPIQKFLSTKWTKNIGKKCDAMLATPWTKTLTA